MSRMWGVCSDFPYPLTISPKQRVTDFSDVLVVWCSLFLYCLTADPNRWRWMCIRQSILIQCRNGGRRKCILYCSTPIWWLKLGWKSISGAMRWWILRILKVSTEKTIFDSFSSPILSMFSSRLFWLHQRISYLTFSLYKDSSPSWMKHKKKNMKYILFTNLKKMVGGASRPGGVKSCLMSTLEPLMRAFQV